MQQRSIRVHDIELNLENKSEHVKGELHASKNVQDNLSTPGGNKIYGFAKQNLKSAFRGNNIISIDTNSE